MEKNSLIIGNLDLSMAYMENWCSDLTLVCGENEEDGEIKCHKNVIASTFDALMKDIVTQQGLTVIRLQHPLKIVKPLVDLIYTKAAKIETDDLETLLSVGQELGVHGLAKATEGQEVKDDMTLLIVEPNPDGPGLLVKHLPKTYGPPVEPQPQPSGVKLEPHDQSHTDDVESPKGKKIIRLELPEIAPVGDGTYKCLRCAKSASTKGSATRHFKLVHTDPDGTFECHLCESQFPRMLYLKNHLRTAHGITQKLVKNAA